ncbi:Armadillo repeat-containing protein 4 [Stylophora pistillata]|uniref:Armadillo repeat-containing protein 4 n=1 Tax=Stylophora pistillata TaxID=50429 RepID=A0A2B4RW07_STYPI|nr:Armadillo repeat-containing protein 4 [Stylophora pistillata]
MCIIFHAKCYFEHIVFPRINVSLICQGKNGAVHLNQCEISGGRKGCKYLPDCNGGPGCVAPSLGKRACDRTGKFGDSESMSGILGFPGVDISHESSGLIEKCVVHNCGGGGALVVGQGSRLLVKKCEVYNNQQAGLEARQGGELEAIGSKIFDNGNHGILIVNLAGKCDVNENDIFENAKQGIIVCHTKEKINLRNNSIHHNRSFGISLDNNPQMFISNNTIFENGFWGILAKGRTSAHIEGNELIGNKCGGIFIGVNYSGRVFLKTNTVRDHSGPWLEYPFKNGSPIIDDKETDALGSDLPEGEKHYYSMPPIEAKNRHFNNEEGLYHPREVAERLSNGCTYCRRRGDKKVRFLKCPGCLIASYCSIECQRHHRRKHKTLCLALKTRYAVDVDRIPRVKQGASLVRPFGTHLKGIGEGPKPKLNEEFIVKIQTQTLNYHPLQWMGLYDKSVTIDCLIQSPEIFNVITECGVLGALHKFTSKKCFFWAMFTEPGGKLTIYLDHLAPYQEWLMEMKVLEILVNLLQNEEGEEDLPEQVHLHIVGAIGEIAKHPTAPLEILRCKGCKTLVDILNIPNEELTGTAARAIAACAVNSSCRAVFNRLEGLRLLWSLMKSRNNQVVSGGAWAVYRLMQDTPVLTSACAVISVVACDWENLGVITDYEVVSHLAQLTHKLLLETIGSEDAALQEAAAGCLLNMRQLAMANERARYQEDTNNDLEADTDSVQQN